MRRFHFCIFTQTSSLCNAQPTWKVWPLGVGATLTQLLTSPRPPRKRPLRNLQQAPPHSALRWRPELFPPSLAQPRRSSLSFSMAVCLAPCPLLCVLGSYLCVVLVLSALLILLLIMFRRCQNARFAHHPDDVETGPCFNCQFQVRVDDVLLFRRRHDFSRFGNSLHTGPNAFFVLLPAICASLLRLTFLLSDFFCKWDVCLPNRNLHGSVSLDKPRVWKTSNKQLLIVLLALAGDLLLDIVVVVARVWDGLNSAFSLSTLALLFFCRRTLRPLPRT